MAKQWPIFLWQCKAAGRSQLQQKKLTITSFFFSWKNMKLTAVCVENARKGNQTKRRCEKFSRKNVKKYVAVHLSKVCQNAQLLYYCPL